MRVAPLVLVVAVGCGGARPAPVDDRDPAPEPAGDTPCGAMLAHVDAVLGPGFTIQLDDQSVNRAALAMQCASLSGWSVACLTLATDAAQLDTCGPGNAPRTREYGGPTPYQHERFEECVAAATTRDAFDACSYDGPDGELLHPPDPP